MGTVIVRYRVKPDQVARNEELVRAVYAELRQTAPAGLRYASFKLADGVSFVHIAAVETTDGRNPLSETRAFRQFTENIAERCDEPPAPIEMTEIGSYRVFTG